MSSSSQRTINMLKKLPATTTLIVINVVVFIIAQFLTGDAATRYESMALVVIPRLGYVSSWWTFITSMFMHGSIIHILCNMVTLYYMGMLIERLFGTLRFLVIYFVSGIAGGLFYVAFNMLAGTAGSAIGASGALFGLFSAYGVMLLIEYRKPVLLPQSISRAQLSSFVGLIIVNILISLSPGIAWEAHLGGLIAGAIIGAAFYSQLRRRMLKPRGE
jgi:rhomboid protease GluP